LSNIQKIKELVAQAQEIQQASTSDYRKFQDKFRKSIAEIELNRNYTGEYKRELKKALKKTATIELMQGSKQYKDKFDGYLKNARQLAKDVIYAKTPEVDQESLDRFSRDFRELKTEIMLSTPARGKEILQQFLGNVNEPALAEIVKNDFADLIQPIVSGAGNEALHYKRDLLKAFEDVKTRSMDEEAREAMQIAEYCDAAMSGKFFNLAVESAVGSEFGRTAKEYLHNPDGYFEKFQEDEQIDAN
jgi:hypothetical protein